MKRFDVVAASPHADAEAPARGRVLLTGASGYVGGRLLRRLEEGARPVRCLARDPQAIHPGRDTTEVVTGDCLDEASLDRALDGVTTAYYLVHSMNAGAQYADLDRRAAGNFGRAAARAGVTRIIYLGGLADDIKSLSTHLRSRAETGEALRAGGVPVVEFRASIVIGAGSLSFEMIRALVERLPVMVCPRWVDTRTQPIAIDDVMAYLEAALDLPAGQGEIFEIGGPEVISYGDIMRRYARRRGLRRLLLPVPILTPHLSGSWLALVTPAQAQVGRALVEGLKNESVVRSPAARQVFAIDPIPLDEAFRRAMADGMLLKRDTREVVVDASPAQAFAPIRCIGGSAGWYFGNGLWKLRGWMDRFVGGTGMGRGRCNQEQCAIGDVIDGWTVEAYEPDRRLRLAADIKMPGRAWLEFEVTPVDGGRRSRIRQTASFDARGVLGRVYWGLVLPVHLVMFPGMLRGIAERAIAPPAPSRKAMPRIGRTALALALGLAAAAPAAAGQDRPVQTVDKVDLPRYVGEWFEIARFPNRFQRQCAGDVRAAYSVRQDGRLDVVNRCRTAEGVTEARGVARIADARTTAKLKVRFAPAVLSFLPAVWGDYWVVGLAPDYSWATVGSPDRKYLWILGRAPSLGTAAYAAALEAARSNGFEVARLVTTPQAGASGTPRP